MPMPRAELIRRLEEGAARFQAEADAGSPAHDECGPTPSTMSRTVAAIFRNFADEIRGAR